MAMAVSSGVQENTISWSSNKLINQSNISVSAGQSYTVSSSIGNTDSDYLRLLANVSVQDTELTTDNFNTVCILYKVLYTDNDGNSKELMDSFFPKFQHEVNNTDTYVIINSPSKNINQIIVEIYNSETTETITVEKLEVQYNNVAVDAGNVEDTVENYLMTTGGVYVPILDTAPDTSDLPADRAYLYILRSLV